VRHFAGPSFWEGYAKLPENIRALADKNYALLKENPRHPSLQLKKVGRFWSVHVGSPTARWLSKSMQVCCGFGLALTPTTTPLSDSLRRGSAYRSIRIRSWAIRSGPR
jgi:hypothetical protein